LQTLNRQPSAFFDLARVLLIPLALAAAAALFLALMPQSAADGLLRQVQQRGGGAARMEVAFLYLGHQIRDGRFHVRGVVRNITPDPIEQLDAVIRLFGRNRDLLETAIVRMDKETIAPNQIARFELVYPDYQSEFSSYSVEFKLRSGKVIPYRDMRESQTESEETPAAGVQQEK
jgi:hypothetical protein